MDPVTLQAAKRASAVTSNTRFGPIRRLAILGDSLAEYGQGFWPYLVGLSQQAVQVTGPEAAKRVFCHPGWTAEGLLTVVNEVTSLNPAPDAVLIQAGTNNLIASRPIPEIVATIKQIYAAMESRGIRVIMSTVPPLGGPYSHNGKQGSGRQLNTALKILAHQTGRIIVDPFSALVDPATQRYAAAYDSGDNVHPSTMGLVAWAQKVLADLTPYLAPAAPLTEGTSGDGVSNWFVNSTMTTGGGNHGGQFDSGLSVSLGATNAVAGITPALTPDASGRFNWQEFSCVSPVGTNLFYTASKDVVPGNKMLVSLRYRRTSGTAGNLQALFSCYHGAQVIDLNQPLLGSTGLSVNTATDMLMMAYFTVPATAVKGQLRISVPQQNATWGIALPTITDLTALGLV